MELHEIILQEEVFSTLAVAYHRTHNVQDTKAISETGFRAGGGRLYGTGIYLTYSFEDQQDERMKRIYGPFVIRCKINLTDFLIFDRDVATQVYGAKGSISDQLLHFGINNDQSDKFQTMLRQAAEATNGTVLSSVPAKSFSRWLAANRRSVRRKIKGLVFTGQQDGRVIVAYDPSTVIPFAWARVIDLNKTRESVKWNKIAAPPLRRSSTPVSQVKRAVFFLRNYGFHIKRMPPWTVLVSRRRGDYLILTLSEYHSGWNNNYKFGVRCACTRQEPTDGDLEQIINGHPERVNGWPIMDEDWTLHHNPPDNLPLQTILKTIFTTHDQIIAERGAPPIAASRPTDSGQVAKI